VTQPLRTAHLTRIARVTLVATLALTVVAGCSPAKAAPASGGSQVAISGFRFQPETLDIPAGTKVTWTNADAILHTVTSGTSTKKDDFGNYELRKTNTFDGTMDDQGKSFSFTFTTPGEFTYFCSRHNNMTGRVVVR
jgi:plastocyanin